ncbi:S9 family peptidase [Flavobacterium sp. W1B]|uniref:S9 family peptidase n=1 Tax=Flavobacterium sp. W1B TaxID=3394146 RepID=UPI0039BD45B5
MIHKVITKTIAISCIFSFYFSWGQSVTKLTLKPDDYDKWSTLAFEDVSPDGKWLMYTLQYDQGPDTLFVIQTKGNRKFVFPAAKQGSFSDDGNWFTAYHPDKGLALQNLLTDRLQWIPSVIKSDFVLNDTFLTLLLKNGQDYNLKVFGLKKKEEIFFKGIKEYALNPNKNNFMIISDSNRVKVIWPSLGFKEKIITGESKFRYKNLIWDNSGTSAVFMQELPEDDFPERNHSLYFVRNVEKSDGILFLNPQEKGSIISGKRILDSPTLTDLEISPDGQRIIFTLGKSEKQIQEKNSVIIWNSTEAMESERKQFLKLDKKKLSIAVWFPLDNKVFDIGSRAGQSVYFTPDRRSVICYDKYQFEPQFEISSPADIVLVDLASGQRTTILLKQSMKLRTIGTSPDGRYLNYYKDKNWWVYDIYAKKHTNLTAGLDNFEDPDFSRSRMPPAYGCPGWANDSSRLIVYSQYDVWLLSPDGKQPRRITSGKNDSIRYRVYEKSSITNRIHPRIYLQGSKFELKNGLFLEATGFNYDSGYFQWEPDSGLVKMVYSNLKIGRLKKARDANTMMLIKQDATLSPQIMVMEKPRERPRIVVKTNPQQLKYNWGKVECISYKISDNQLLNGILYYPANYKPDRLYPMVVKIYETQFEYLHHYFSPTSYMPAGFSPTNYTTDGYFVLYPDIIYKVGQPGYSAVKCVEEAVKKAITMGRIDAKRIGLIGHSYGGYEAAFIATRSKLFATVVSGAAVTDMVSHSLTQDITGRSMMWRYVSHQMRMGEPLYDDYQGYMENSPLTNAKNIDIPLLSWSGKEDLMVDFRQSTILHMAMRSLNKKHILLIYPGDGHSLSKPEFQKDLTTRIKAWFDFYLKDIPLPPLLGM